MKKGRHLVTRGQRGHRCELKDVFKETGDDLRPHQQCPRETKDIGHRFKFQTEDPMCILVFW